MSEKSEKPVALVTGASRGIGAEIARALGRDGFHVIVNFSSSEGKAKEVVSSVEAAGGSGETLGFDVGDAASIVDAFSKVKSRHGKLACLVNNAGITCDGILIRQKDEDIARVLDVNLRGAILCAREAIPLLMKNRGGSLIQIASVVGEMGNAGQAAYAASKAGLIGFTKSIAKEFASRGIRANAVAPGFIVSDMTEALTEAQKEAILRAIPLGTFGKPEDVAHAVSFLASSRGAYLTGQVLGVNGGLYT